VAQQGFRNPPFGSHHRTFARSERMRFAVSPLGSNPFSLQRRFFGEQSQRSIRNPQVNVRASHTLHGETMYGLPCFCCIDCYGTYNNSISASLNSLPRRMFDPYARKDLRFSPSVACRFHCPLRVASMPRLILFLDGAWRVLRPFCFHSSLYFPLPILIDFSPCTLPPPGPSFCPACPNACIDDQPPIFSAPFCLTRKNHFDSKSISWRAQTIPVSVSNRHLFLFPTPGIARSLPYMQHPDRRPFPSWSSQILLTPPFAVIVRLFSSINVTGLFGRPPFSAMMVFFSALSRFGSCAPGVSSISQESSLTLFLKFLRPILTSLGIEELRLFFLSPERRWPGFSTCQNPPRLPAFPF